MNKFFLNRYYDNYRGIRTFHIYLLNNKKFHNRIFIYNNFIIEYEKIYKMFAIYTIE